MREIVFDTETTGLDPYEGHRLVEVGCIELLNHFPTGRTFHSHINPERNVSPEAFSVHGLSSKFLKDKPLFADIADDLMNFIGGTPLVAHNASFHLGFLNTELKRAGLPAMRHRRVVDTLLLAQRKYPWEPNHLDDLCRRLEVSSRRRTKHSALLDAELVAKIYIKLIGARQAGGRGGRLAKRSTTKKAMARAAKLKATKRRIHSRAAAHKSRHKAVRSGP
jgi:DNA polymerase-3 subunit epsilon